MVNLQHFEWNNGWKKNTKHAKNLQHQESEMDLSLIAANTADMNVNHLICIRTFAHAYRLNKETFGVREGAAFSLTKKQQPLCRTESPPRGPRWSKICPLCRICCRRPSPCCQQWRRSWPTSNWNMRPLKKSLDGVVRTVTEEDIAAAVRQ